MADEDRASADKRHASLNNNFIAKTGWLNKWRKKYANIFVQWKI